VIVARGDLNGARVAKVSKTPWRRAIGASQTGAMSNLRPTTLALRSRFWRTSPASSVCRRSRSSAMDKQGLGGDDAHLGRLHMVGRMFRRARSLAICSALLQPLAEAFGIKTVRDWFEVSPRTGEKHLPGARESAAPWPEIGSVRRDRRRRRCCLHSGSTGG